jgi:hypothetical protein
VGCGFSFRVPGEASYAGIMPVMMRRGQITKLAALVDHYYHLIGQRSYALLDSKVEDLAPIAEAGCTGKSGRGGCLALW